MTPRVAGSFASEEPPFGAWLQGVLRARGITKNALLQRLGRGPGTSTEHLNRYIEKGMTPTVQTVERIAAALEISPSLALLKAGYLHALLPKIAMRMRNAAAFCAEHHADFAACMNAEEYVSREAGVADPRFFRCTLGGYGMFSIPYAALEAVYIAIVAFPLRGERYKPRLMFGDVETALQDPVTNDGVERAAGKLPAELSAAMQVLRNRKIAVEHRRAAAAELVRSWVLSAGGTFAAALRDDCYEPTAPLQPLNVSLPSIVAEAKYDLMGVEHNK